MKVMVRVRVKERIRVRVRVKSRIKGKIRVKGNARVRVRVRVNNVRTYLTKLLSAILRSMSSRAALANSRQRRG